MFLIHSGDSHQNPIKFTRVVFRWWTNLGRKARATKPVLFHQEFLFLHSFKTTKKTWNQMIHLSFYDAWNSVSERQCVSEYHSACAKVIQMNWKQMHHLCFRKFYRLPASYKAHFYNWTNTTIPHDLIWPNLRRRWLILSGSARKLDKSVFGLIRLENRNCAAWSSGIPYSRVCFF